MNNTAKNKRPYIYIAAPLFNDMEREFNIKLTESVERLADAFLPQRDGALMKNLVLNNQMSAAAARMAVFQRDIDAISKADALIAVLDGRTIDEGVAFELGYARALGKHCIGLKTDDRSLLPSGDNPMIVLGCNKICSSMQELHLLLDAFCQEEPVNQAT